MMSRQFVRSLILAAVLGTANAGPCKPSGTTIAVSESTIETSTGGYFSVETQGLNLSSRMSMIVNSLQ